jgi:pimeloyl-ACP methyl ester carboxylesterase
MPVVTVNGIRLGYEDHGSGPPVVLVTGANSRGRTWTLHQVPALIAAGYRCVTVDNRGVPPTEAGPDPFTVDDMAADVAALIEYLGLAPCRVVGFSLGGIIVQEMLLTHPDLASQAVLIATRGRRDALREMVADAEQDLLDSGVVLPPRYAAVVQAMQYLSPRTLNDDRKVRDWLDVFEFSQDPSISRAQRGVDAAADRLEEYRKIGTQCLAVGFGDDLIIPPHLCRELAAHIPDCRYVELDGCGHYGHLEQPQVLNTLLLDFFATASRTEES